MKSNNLRQFLTQFHLSFSLFALRFEILGGIRNFLFIADVSCCEFTCYHDLCTFKNLLIVSVDDGSVPRLRGRFGGKCKALLLGVPFQFEFNSINVRHIDHSTPNEYSPSGGHGVAWIYCKTQKKAPFSNDHDDFFQYGSAQFQILLHGAFLPRSYI